MVKINFRSLTVTLAVVFLTFSTVVLFIFSGLDIYSNFRHQRETIILQQQFISQETACAVNFFIQKLIVLARSASLGDLVTVSLQEQRPVLDRLLVLEPAFRQLALLNAQGDELLKVSRLSHSEPDSLTAQERSALLSGVSPAKAHIGPVYIDRISDEPFTIMAIGLKDSLDESKGILLAEVNLKFICNLVGRMKIGNQGLTYIVDRQGKLAAFGDIRRVLESENLFQTNNRIKEFLKGSDKTGTKISRGIRGNYVLSTVTPLNIPDWLVVVESPVAEAYATVITALKILIFVIFLGFILAIVLGIYLSRIITQPITELSNAARRVSTGSLDEKIEARSKDEIGELAGSFNQMVNDLKSTTTSIGNLEREIAARKQIEIELKNTSEQLMQSSGMASLGKLAGGFAHEINNHLSGVVNNIQMLKMLESGEMLDRKRLKELCVVIESSALCCKSIIKSLSDFSRAAKGVFQPVQLNIVLSQVLGAVDKQIQADHIIIQKDYQSVLPDIQADPQLLQQVVINLLVNAQWAINQRQDKAAGVIIFRTWSNLSENKVCLSVSDNGIGMPQENLPRVFEPFFTTKDICQGAGLGLSLAYKIIENHNATIEVKSQVGIGSVFTISFSVRR